MFVDKTVLITGASSGLGKSLAVAFARQRGNLVLAGRNTGKLEETEKACRALHAKTLTVQTDVTRPEQCENLIDRAAAAFGSIDYLIANAGISMWAKFEEIEAPSLFQKLMETNYLGVVYCCYFALPHLKKSKGMIVAISSIQGKIGVPLHTGYAGSKYALNGFLDSLRTEVAGNGIDILVAMPHWLKGTQLRQNALGADGKAIGAARKQHSSEALTPEAAVAAIIDAIKKRKRESIIPAKLSVLPWLKLIAPRFLDALVKRKINRQNGAQQHGAETL